MQDLGVLAYQRSLILSRFGTQDCFEKKLELATNTIAKEHEQARYALKADYAAYLRKHTVPVRIGSGAAKVILQRLKAVKKEDIFTWKKNRSDSARQSRWIFVDLDMAGGMTFRGFNDAPKGWVTSLCIAHDYLRDFLKLLADEKVECVDIHYHGLTLTLSGKGFRANFHDPFPAK